MPLWLEALNSDNIELQRRASETITLAKRRGMTGLDQAVEPLLALFQKADVDGSVRRAVANALTSIDAKETAIDFSKVLATANDIQLQSICETAIANWQSDCMVSEWRERLVDSSNGTTTRVLAIRGLAKLSDSSSLRKIYDIVLDEKEPFAERYEASKAFGLISKAANLDKGDTAERIDVSEVIATSKGFSDSETIVIRLLGVNLITGYSETLNNEKLTELILKYAVDRESTVATIAWQSLLASSNPRVLDSKIGFGIENRDFKIRRQAVELLSGSKSGEAAKKLGQLLNDKHPKVRSLARKTLLEFAKDESLVDDVIVAADTSLRSDWQGIQQGLLILCELNHKPSAKTCIELELLDHDRGEVHITAAWLLERLSVDETFGYINSYLEKHVTQIKSGKSGRYAASQYEAYSHLIQLLGRNQYKAMEEVVIAKLIPKDMGILDYPIRPAAIWAIGKIYAGQELPEKYVSPLIARLDDENPQNPESKYVKTMCAFTFGTTKTNAALDFLREFARKSGRDSRLGFYCHWAINQLTKEPIPPSNESKKFETRWFLRPLK